MTTTKMPKATTKAPLAWSRDHSSYLSPMLRVTKIHYTFSFFFEVRTLHKLFITAGADVRRVVALSEAFVLLPFLFFRVNAVESNLLESCCSITQHWGHKVTRFPFLRLP